MTRGRRVDMVEGSATSGGRRFENCIGVALTSFMFGSSFLLHGTTFSIFNDT